MRQKLTVNRFGVVGLGFKIQKAPKGIIRKNKNELNTALLCQHSSPHSLYCPVEPLVFDGCC